MENNVATTQQIPWIRIIGWAVLIHVILIALSILEVWVYSTFINTGQRVPFYQAHAEATAPYISIIFGIIIFYLVARLLTKNRPEKKQVISFALPIIYIIIDVILLVLAKADWGQEYLIFITSFATKILSSYAGSRVK